MDVDQGVTMKVFFDNNRKSFGIGRVVTNLDKHLPEGFERVKDPLEADLIVMHINGRRNHRHADMEKILARGQQYAVCQYVLKSCRNPDPNDWTELWGNAKVMWSYYDLREYVTDMYFQPLGADPEIFYREDVEKKFMLGTTGGNYKDECYLEGRMAAFMEQGKLVHVGESTPADPHVTLVKDISDDEMRNIYNSCKWFSVLRRKDGFEMPAVEAIMCGVRPILFDTPNYRTWFNDFATYIPETSPAETVRNLRNIIKTEPEPVTDDLIEAVKEKFDWKKLIAGFWERCAT